MFKKYNCTQTVKGIFELFYPRTKFFWGQFFGDSLHFLTEYM